MEKILTIDNISKEFGGKTVVDQVSFEVGKGEIMGVLGPNGAFNKNSRVRCDNKCSDFGVVYLDCDEICR